MRKILNVGGGFLALSCVLVVGCQTAAPSVEIEVVEEEMVEENEAAVELVYEDLEKYEEIFPRQLDWRLGPLDDVEVQWLAGEEAIVSIEDNENIFGLDSKFPNTETTIADVLRQPGAVALQMVARAAPLPDIVEYFVPVPVEGPEEIADLVGKMPGIMLSTPTGWPRFGESREEAEEDLDRWTKLDGERLASLLESGESFVVYQHMTGCGGAARGRRQLAGLGLPEDFPLYVDDDFEAVKEHFEDRRVRLPSSSFLAFYEGEWIDFHPSTNLAIETIEHFFRRVGLFDEGNSEPFITADHFGEDVHLALALTSSNYWTSLSMRGEDLRGMRIWNGAISGSDFADADLSGGVFKNVLLARTTFEGADFSDVQWENVTLREVVCIDGEIRSGEVEGCLTEGKVEDSLAVQ